MQRITTRIAQEYDHLDAQLSVPLAASPGAIAAALRNGDKWSRMDIEFTAAMAGRGSVQASHSLHHMSDREVEQAGALLVLEAGDSCHACWAYRLSGCHHWSESVDYGAVSVSLLI